jgi:hypothetical protein
MSEVEHGASRIKKEYSDRKVKQVRACTHSISILAHLLSYCLGILGL